MRITAITRYKHGDLYAVLKEMGWSQMELSRRSGVPNGHISKIMNLRQRPGKAVALAIQKAFERGGRRLDVLEMWPEAFEGFRRSPIKEETVDVPMENLLECREAMLLPAPSECHEDLELQEAVNDLLEGLSPREKDVIKSRVFAGKTQESTGEELGLCSVYVGSLEREAMDKLKSQKAIEFLERRGFSRSEYSTTPCPVEEDTPQTRAERVRELIRKSKHEHTRTVESNRPRPRTDDVYRPDDWAPSGKEVTTESAAYCRPDDPDRTAEPSLQADAMVTNLVMVDKPTFVPFWVEDEPPISIRPRYIPTGRLYKNTAWLELDETGSLWMASPGGNVLSLVGHSREQEVAVRLGKCLWEKWVYDTSGERPQWVKYVVPLTERLADCDCERPSLDADSYQCEKCSEDLTICSKCSTILRGCQCGRCPDGRTFIEA